MNALRHFCVAVLLASCVCSTACRKEDTRAPDSTVQQRVDAAPPRLEPQLNAEGLRVTGPTVIIAARRTWDGGRRSRGPLDSLRSALEASSSELRDTLQRRGATVLLDVADS